MDELTLQLVDNRLIRDLHRGDDLCWKTITTAIIKKAQHRLHFLRVLKDNAFAKELLVSFYSISIENTLTYCIPVWNASSTAQEKASLQRIISTAQKIIGCAVHSLEPC